MAVQSAGPRIAIRREPIRDELVLLVTWIAAIFLFFSLMSEHVFTVRNLTNVLGQASIIMLLAVGVAIVFIVGEVDISVGSIVAAVAIPLIEIMNENISPYTRGGRHFLMRLRKGE